MEFGSSFFSHCARIELVQGRVKMRTIEMPSKWGCPVQGGLSLRVVSVVAGMNSADSNPGETKERALGEVFAKCPEFLVARGRIELSTRGFSVINPKLHELLIST